MAGEKIITPPFRAGFVALFRPKTGVNDDGTPQKPKYSVQAAFPPSADLSKLKALAAKAAFDKWGEKAGKMTLRSPFRLNDELDKPLQGVGMDWTIMSFSSNEDFFNPRINMVGPRNEPIIDEVEIYSGAWFKAQVNAKDYERKGNKGVTFYLANIQKVKDDEPIGSGSAPANKAFEAVDGAEAESASDLFK